MRAKENLGYWRSVLQCPPVTGSFVSRFGLRRISITPSYMSGFSRVSNPPSFLRQRYLHALAEPQEWFLEELIGSGQFWMREDGSYGVTYGKTLVEYYCVDPEEAVSLLRDFLFQHGFSTVLVKSFDVDLVRSCEQLGWVRSVAGMLFRKRTPHLQTSFPGADIRATTPNDVRAIWEINESFFESITEIEKLAASGKLWTVRVNGEIAGCGLTNRVIENGDAVDVGMMVGEAYRRRGLGTFIVSEISQRIESMGLRPICGCAAHNIASKATLEKAGFISEHHLLSFSK